MGSNHQTTTVVGNNRFDVNTKNEQHTTLEDTQNFNSHVKNVHNHHGRDISGQVDNLQGMNNSGHQVFKLVNLDELDLQNLIGLNEKVHHGDTVNGSMFDMHNVNVEKGGFQVMSDVGNNRVNINKMANKAGGTTVFMAPVKLQNLIGLNEKVHHGDTVNGSLFDVHNLNVEKGGFQVMSDVGNNRVNIDKMANKAGGTTVFMAPVKLLI